MFANKVNVNKHYIASKHGYNYHCTSWMISPASIALSLNMRVVTFLQPRPSAFCRNRGGENTLLLFRLLMATLRLDLMTRTKKTPPELYFYAGGTVWSQMVLNFYFLNKKNTNTKKQKYSRKATIDNTSLFFVCWSDLYLICWPIHVRIPVDALLLQYVWPCKK